MKSLDKLSNKDQVLWALKECTTTDAKSALLVREAIEKAGFTFTSSSHSAAMAYIWKKFGTVKGGMGLFDRVKKGPAYAYYKATPEVDEYTFEELKKPHASKQKETREPSPGVSPTATATPIPETLNVNLKVTWDINLNFNGLKDLFK